MVCAEFAVDPCRTTKPYQIVLAVIPRRDTLAATLADLALKIHGWSPKYSVELGTRDVLLIPNMCFEVTHHFRELEGEDKLLLNPGFETLWIETAMQTVAFRLDRSGAELAAESKIFCKPLPTYFALDRPFLLFVKKRGAETPFLVMWVENAELLSKRQPGKQRE